MAPESHFVMQALKDIRGLKYPDEFVIRHFFKRGLHRKTGRVLELGSGVGNNLSLYLQYGWRCTGVDLLSDALADCAFNYGTQVELIEADLSAGMPPSVTGPFDVLLIPNLLCYLRAAEVDLILPQMKAQLAPGADIFVRTRLTDDYRYGRGQEVEPDGFILDTPETGEAGLFNRFYTEHGLVRLLADGFAMTDPTWVRCSFDNPQNGRRVANSDLIVWGAAG